VFSLGGRGEMGEAVEVGVAAVIGRLHFAVNFF
jgi:hypothetical protein